MSALCLFGRSEGLQSPGQLGKRQAASRHTPTPRNRDLGSGYARLNVLWISACGLEELDGIGSMRSLRELYAAYNRLADLTSLAEVEGLELADLEAWAPCF